MGIYRVPGSLSSINALKAALDSGEEVRMDDDRWYDINAIAGCFKLFMRELPGPTISSEKLGHLKTLTGMLATCMYEGICANYFQWSYLRKLIESMLIGM